jgi:hypothetical protein
MPEFRVATKAVIFNTKLQKHLVLKKTDISSTLPKTPSQQG